MELFKGFPASSATPPLKTGVIGMGKMGRLRAGYIQRDPRMSLVAVCDVADIPGLPEGVSVYHDYRELLQADLDVVYACAVNWVLPDIVVAALKSGRHVFCEKPPGRNAEDVRRIMEEEQCHPELCLWYGFNHRRHYSVMKAKELIASGELGEVLWMRGVYGKCGGENFASSWRNNRDLTGGGILLDQGIHMLDIFHYFGLGESEVKSFVATSHWNINAEDNAFILLSDGRRHAMLHSSATQWKHCFRLEIGLSGGFITLDGLNTGSRSYGEETITWGKSQMAEDIPIAGRPIENREVFNTDDSWAWEQDGFVKSVSGEVPKVSQSNSALHVMSTIRHIYQDGGNI